MIVWQAGQGIVRYGTVRCGVVWQEKEKPCVMATRKAKEVLNKIIITRKEVLNNGKHEKGNRRNEY